MRISILTYGTRGDVQPILALGDELARRGHSVVLVVNENLAAWARRSGLEVVPTGPDTEAFLKSPEGQRMLATGKLMQFSREQSRVDRAAGAEIVAATMKACAGADLVISTVLSCYRGACVAAATGVRHATLWTFPAMTTRRWSSLLFGGVDLGLGALNHASFALLHHLWWRDQRPAIDDMCRALGIPRFRRRPRIEEMPALNIFSEHVAPRPDDWPANHEVVGFLPLSPELRRRLGEAELRGDLEAWLDRGPPPVFFGFGSMPVLEPGTLLRQVSELTRRRGVRALVGAGWSDLGGVEVAEHVRVAAAFDHDRVLPRCAAAVHHGGAGTTATALRAGLPSVVAHVFADQPFWGRRVAELGAGVRLPYRDLGATSLEAALAHVLDDATAERARAVGARLRAEPSLERAADVVERWLGADRRAAPRLVA